MTTTTVLLAAGRATAHPQASPDRNNRYVKLTPMADRLRLAYTVYLGEQPGAHARRRLDRNGDGTIDDREARALGDELAAQIQPAVELTVDDRAATIEWSTIDVGLGTPTVAAGALSVDLIGWACTDDAARHHVVLRDRVRIDAPGEVEVKLEEGPGVAFAERRLGAAPMPDLVATWRGDDDRLATGLDVAYAVDGALATRPSDGRCQARAASRHSRRPLAYAVAAIAGAALGVAAIVLTRRRRRRPAARPIRT